MTSAEAVYGVMGLGVIAYALTAGADFGGGVLDLLARGPLAGAQRRAIERAIAPIWEANHVWLIFVVVLCFAAFPRAFAAISIALHVPLVALLVAITLRGAAFTFRAYGLGDGRQARGYGLLFGLSSLLAPLLLGVIVAALVSGQIRLDIDDGSVRVLSPWTAGWLTPFAAATGALAVALFALLAAVYLFAETDGLVSSSFARIGMALLLVSFVLAGLTLGLAREGAYEVWYRLARSPWSTPLQAAAAASGVVVALSLLRGQRRLARAGAALLVALVVGGLGVALDGRLVVPDLTIGRSGPGGVVTDVMLWATAAGAVVLAPALWWLFAVFKRQARANDGDEAAPPAS